MAYDAFNRLVKPDFQSQADLPQWQPMGDDKDLSVSPFVDALKKRMSRGREGGGTGSMMGNEIGGTKSGRMSSL